MGDGDDAAPWAVGSPFRRGPDPRRGRGRNAPEHRQVREAARRWGYEAIEVLADAMRHSSDDRVRVLAAQALLERGYGKPQSAPEDLEALASTARPLADVVTEIVVAGAMGRTLEVLPDATSKAEEVREVGGSSAPGADLQRDATGGDE